MNYAKRIEELRNERKWTIYRLSLKSGVSQQTIKSIPDNNDIQMSTIQKLSDAFELSLSEFLKDETTDTMEITQEQRQLLTDWSALMKDEQIALRKIIQALIDSQR